jgi:cytoskeletal protein CcmA (bactofilin family)
MDISDFKTSRFNIIGGQSRMKGELYLSGPSTLSGEIEGEIHASSDSQLVIEKTARVTGLIRGHDVEIHGHFEGHLEASGTLILRPGSLTQGIVKANKLVIYPGATLDGETAAGA